MNFSDKWLAPRPGTDAALAAAIAYTWITEGSYDKEYIENVLTDLKNGRNISWVRKTALPRPRMGGKRVGRPCPRDKGAGQGMGQKRTMLAAGGVGGWGGACRAAYGTEWSRMMVLLQAMQGIGKPGINIWSTTQGVPYNADFYFPGYTEGASPGPRPATVTRDANASVKSTINDAGGAHIPRILVPECIMDPPRNGAAKDFAGTHRKPV